ncbi:hypothetical protein HHK36_025491 [Tetracentron sinense]|uniref:LOB domain-containing protein n=1 Tax=Tetracentron sinense TaxID=13715 RepID=A0A834YKJ5_TETSI|nr:hypothetical protein HHK36_025491 [Tetracentron sinense]
MSLPRATGNGTTGTQACAACKYQRRKCAPDCILAPYFPPDHQRQFLNAHKLFGVSNILKILRNLHPLEKDEAMRTMIYQADARAIDPVGGCHRIIRELQCQIEHDQAELDLVLHQLAVFRAIQMQDPNVSLQGLAINPDPVNIYNPMHYSNNQHQHQLQHSFHYDQQQQGVINQWAMHDPGASGMDMEGSSSLASSHAKQSFFNEGDEIKPALIGTYDERESQVEFSEKDALKEEANSIQHVQEHDLKGAASLFTLTNCNS